MTRWSLPSNGAARLRRTHMKRRVVAAVAVLAVLLLALGMLNASASKKLRSSRVGAGVRLQLSKERAEHQLARQGRAVERLQKRVPILRRGSGSEREVALTFDDGPSPYTAQILDTLIRHHVPATFFPVGLTIDEYPELIRRETANGFAIGDHTEGHVRMKGLPPAEQRAELRTQAAKLRSLGAPFPRLFRPPFGEYDANTLKLLRRERMLMVLWTVETGDYEVPGEEAIVQRVLEEVHPGAIILLHDGGGDRSETVAALPRIVRELRDRGYRFVTIPQLALDSSPEVAG